MNAKLIFETGKKFVTANAPSILTAVGVVGFVTTTVVACEQTPKAMRLIEKRKDEKRIVQEANGIVGNDIKLTPFETFVEGSKAYWPAVLLGTSSALCIIFANKLNLKRNAALLAMYTLTEKELKNYKDGVAEVVGEKKVEAIKDAVSKKIFHENKPDAELVNSCKENEMIFYERMSGRYDKGTTSMLERAEAEFNRVIANRIKFDNDDAVTLNDWYECLENAGFKNFGCCDIGDCFGIRINNMADIFKVSTKYGETDEEGKFFVKMEYNIPINDYLFAF